MIQFPHLFIYRVNWNLRKGLSGKKDFCTLKYSFEIISFDSGVKERLIDKWSTESVTNRILMRCFLSSFIMLCCFLLLWWVFVLSIGSSWNLLFLCNWTCSPGRHRPLTPNKTAVTLITDQTCFVLAALGFNILECWIDYKHTSLK